MKDKINDIYNNLNDEIEEEEDKRAKKVNNDMLINRVVNALFNEIELSDEKEALIVVYSTSKWRKIVCDNLSNNQEEFYFLFSNYNTIINKLYNIFKADIKIEKLERKQNQKEPKRLLGIKLANILPLTLYGIITAKRK